MQSRLNGAFVEFRDVPARLKPRPTQTLVLYVHGAGVDGFLAGDAFTVLPPVRGVVRFRIATPDLRPGLSSVAPPELMRQQGAHLVSASRAAFTLTCPLETEIFRSQGLKPAFFIEISWEPEATPTVEGVLPT